MSLPELAFEYRCRPQSMGGGVYGNSPSYDLTRKPQNKSPVQRKRHMRDDEDEVGDYDEHEAHHASEEAAPLPMRVGGDSPKGQVASVIDISKEGNHAVEAMQMRLNTPVSFGNVVMPGGVRASHQASMFANTLPQWLLFNAAMNTGRAPAAMHW